ncbi:hypothetical protein [Clostridium baratii]|uniref:hypothetical protein n=1 Tax=Clostridium baratii TaxID=1561 RepID=UPI0005F2BB80|nr:hypothetical protein [Clostridium baratii]AQM58518.1 hypothetical protein NPD11_3018 [Clostridium baratii]KJU71536.1 hypothetical protein UC77_08965 [Clostridium baratii]
MKKKISIEISDKTTSLNLTENCTVLDLLMAMSVILNQIPTEARPYVLDKLSKLNNNILNLEIVK